MRFNQSSNRCTYNHKEGTNFSIDVPLFRRLENLISNVLSNAKIQNMENWNIELEPFPHEKCISSYSIRNIYTIMCTGRTVTRARNHAFPVRDTTNTFLWLVPIFSVGEVRLSIPETVSREFQRRGKPSVLFRARNPESDENISRQSWNRILLSREQTTKSCRNRGWPARMKSRNKWILLDLRYLDSL